MDIAHRSTQVLVTCDVRDIHDVSTSRMNTFGNSRMTQYVRRGIGYPCPFDCTGKYLEDALHLLTQKRKMRVRSFIYSEGVSADKCHAVA